MELRASIFEKREQSLINTEKAIWKHPDEFQEIKTIASQVVRQPVDIDEYYDTALRLATLMEKMGPNTMFEPYFLDNVDPRRNCQARYFRFICRDLNEQIKILNHWRKERLQLRVIK